MPHPSLPCTLHFQSLASLPTQCFKPMSACEPTPCFPQRNAAFSATNWNLVLAVGKSDEAVAAEALAKLCQTYWYPLYAYVRRKGYDAHEAEDLTQGFFHQLLRLQSIKQVRGDGK